MKRSDKHFGNKKEKASKFEVKDWVETYGNHAHMSQGKSDNKVIILRGGSGKKITLSGCAPRRAFQKEWHDLYNNIKISASVAPLHYHSKMELVELAQEGISAKSIDRLTELLKITKKQASEFFHFSERSLNDYVKHDKVLDPDSSEKILKIFSLYLFGLEVFGSSDSFINWLSKPSIGLRNKLPTTLLSSSDGIDLVQEELSRIEYGDLA